MTEKTNPAERRKMATLAEMLEKAKDHVMSPADIAVQRKSWVCGEMLLRYPSMTYDEASALYDRAGAAAVDRDRTLSLNIADQVEPGFRITAQRSCTGHYAKRWQAAYDGARIALEKAAEAEADLRPGVEVKPLDWIVFCSRSGNCEAKTPFGQYVVQNESEKCWRWYLPWKEDHEGEFRTCDEARAAAEADFKSRIIASLPSAAPDFQARLNMQFRLGYNTALEDAPAPETETLSQEVITLVIAAREAFDTGAIPIAEERFLDKALEAFASRVPYENEPETTEATQ